MTNRDQDGTATRGLATVALLKVNFDEGRDHLAMFEPFVRDAIGQATTDSVTVADVRAAIHSRHQLSIPQPTIKTLLGRVSNTGLVNREGGLYIIASDRSSVPDLQRRRAEIETRQIRLAEALRESASITGLDVRSNEDALAMILRFLERYHLSVALSNLEEVQPRAQDDEEPDQSLAVTAKFLYGVITEDQDLRPILQELLEGFILQNALLLKDISTVQRKFQHLRVFFDSSLLFGALGCRGPAQELATREFIDLLLDTGGSVEVFDITIQEMDRILAVYEEHLHTPAGRQTLLRTDLTRHFFATNATSSDVRQFRSLLKGKIRKLGFSIRSLPSHEIAYTLDENELGCRLAGPTGNRTEPRVVHDVDCVAGVLSIRRGSTSEQLDHAVCVFAGNSGLTVRTVEEWYRAQGEAGVPPMTHYLLLSNIAWLKRPQRASQLKLHELAALCAAALRPSRKTWDNFLRQLRLLQESGDLSSDEAVALVAGGLTDEVLAEYPIDDDSDASTISEAVERVKDQYREQGEADARVAEERIARLHERAQRADEQYVQTKLRIQEKADRIGDIMSRALTMVLALAFLAGSIQSVVTAVSGSVPGIPMIILAVVPLAIGVLLGLFNGFHIKEAQVKMRAWIATELERWVLSR